MENAYMYPAQRKRVRRPFWITAIAVVLFMGVYLPMASSLMQALTASRTPTVAAAASVAHAETAVPAPAGSAAIPSAPATTAPAVQTVSYPACTPLSFGQPSQLSLSNAPDGLTAQDDNPTLYQIYGGSANQLQAQLNRCAPGGPGGSAEFTGETNYTLTWQYGTYSTDGLSCSLTNVKVGLHTAIALPYWQPTAGAVSGLAARWQSFANGLSTHEQGHVAIDEQYASKLTGDLQAVGTVNCADISAIVAGITNGDVLALNNANDAYDTQTNHGATQGAVVPTH